MVETELSNSPLSRESQEVLNLVEQHKSFLLSGGAGSGKTYSLVEILKEVLSNNLTSNVACITYTNAAVDEIEERVQHDHLVVSTIHDFLWDNIRHFQSELKQTLIELVNDEDEKKFKIPSGEILDSGCFDGLDKGIRYKEFVKLKKGIVSHDEVIVLATRMYEKYEKLCSITKDKYPYIFVDEYQDTDPNVVKILLEYLDKSHKKNVIGFFGDSMQAIYDGSVGDLEYYKSATPPLVQEVIKEQNRRNPQLIINLANQLRQDGISQRPSEDLSAPNMDRDGKPKQGRISFIYSDNDSLDDVRRYLRWDFNDASTTKELNLTHNLIAEKAGFEELMRIYDKDKNLEFVKRVKGFIKENELEIPSEGKTFGEVYALASSRYEKLPAKLSPTKMQKAYIERYPSAFELAKEMAYDDLSSLYIDKEQLVDDKKNSIDDESKPSSNRDDLIKHLFKIETCLRLYLDKRFNEFIRATDYRINSVKDKSALNEALQKVAGVHTDSIGDVISIFEDLKIVRVDDKLENFITNKRYLYEQVIDLPYSQFRNLYDYLEGYTPFSTQHKTKGAEYPNVLVVLDNGKWNSYNFQYLFEGEGEGKDTVLRRSEKIFYVCCTRAKEQLAVFFHRPSVEVLDKAREWFGQDNIVNLDSIDLSDPSFDIDHGQSSNSQEGGCCLVTRKATEPLRTDVSFEERWRSQDQGLITAWEVGRKLRLRDQGLVAKVEKGVLPLLGFKGGVEKGIKAKKRYGTLHYLAQLQGIKGVDLLIDTGLEYSLICSSSGVEVVYTIDATKYSDSKESH